jgi:hypothetical protein
MGACGALAFLLAVCLPFASPLSAADDAPESRQPGQEIDRRLAVHWASRGIAPAAAADDATLYRRAAIDLTGRIPTVAEWRTFVTDKGTLEERHAKAVQQFLAAPEFALHFGAVLDAVVQGPAAGNAEFIDYLRRSLRQRRPWDGVFREVMLGPWESDESRPARRYLETRAKELDRMTTDTARVFFGVDISCARCHDHPLVDDFKQDHYYGMASFFNRTTGGKGSVGEKNEGDVTFRAADGTQKKARVMFLSGVVAEDPSDAKAKVSRREQLVSLALAERKYFSRSFVNRIWMHFFGRGLVQPVDQMHSANLSSVPGLLEWLADDFATSGYDVQRLAAGIVLSRAYRLSSQWDSDAPLPEEGDFAVARVRLLPRREYAMSFLVATGRAEFTLPSADSRLERIAGVRGLKRIEEYLAAEASAAAIQKNLDPGTDGQSSAVEALFVSNAEPIQQLVRAEPKTLVATLATQDSSRQIVEAAISQVFSRKPTDGEVDRMIAWLDEQGSDRTKACERLLWAMLTSAEFRCNH